MHGLTFIPNFITSHDEARLLSHIDQSPWQSDLKRRVQHYGHRYEYRPRQSIELEQAPPITNWLQTICANLVAREYFASVPDQVIINEYLPGQGIAPHIDRPEIFGPAVASLSLGAPAIMRFDNPMSGETFDLDLAPCSLLILSDAARFCWRHGIASRKSDIINNQKRSRKRRVSLTFRTVRRNQ